MNKLKALLLLLIINNNQTLTVNQNTKDILNGVVLLTVGVVVGGMLNKYYGKKDEKKAENNKGEVDKKTEVDNKVSFFEKKKFKDLGTQTEVDNKARQQKVYTIKDIHNLKGSSAKLIENVRGNFENAVKYNKLGDETSFKDKYILQECFFDAFMLFIVHKNCTLKDATNIKELYDPYFKEIRCFSGRLISRYVSLKEINSSAADKLITVVPGQRQGKFPGANTKQELTMPTDAIYTLVQYLLLCNEVNTTRILFQKKNETSLENKQVAISIGGESSDIPGLLEQLGCRIGFNNFELEGFDKDKSALAPFLSDCCDFTFVVDSKALNNHSAYIAMINKIFEHGDGCIFLSKRQKNNGLTDKQLKEFDVEMNLCCEGISYHKQGTIGVNHAANCVSQDGSSHYYFIQKNKNIVTVYNPSANHEGANSLKPGIFDLNIDEEPPRINEHNKEDVSEISLPFLLDITSKEKSSKVFAITFIPKSLFPKFMFQDNNNVNDKQQEMHE